MFILTLILNVRGPSYLGLTRSILTNCSLYDTYRVAMYEQACRINPEFPLYDNLDKFVFLVNDMQLETLKYVYKACQLRRNTMYKR